MGVPAFFRWLSLKYNKIVSHCVEEKGKQIDENTKLPVDTSLPNPNEIEFDNLYLDMNGIIHPCTHPENKPAPKNEDEMFYEIFLYMDRIFSVVRPRRLIYLAVDGVAPRAKMNQQRSRRFRAGKETREKKLTIEKLRQELLQRGAKLPEPKPESEHFDSNCITPGTPFMARLALALQYYVYDKLNSDPGWKNIEVILSDASAPGEGEHKIMDYIRRQRASPTHDPNTKHCLCGADADLIMLGLATHEPYFTIIREEFKPNQPRPCELCGQFDHAMTECQGLASAEFNTGVNKSGADCEFIFIHINILREYLSHDLMMVNLPFKYDFERAIDDWVFMCFFVGNDFLPHLPSLEIREKAIDRLIDLYKKSVHKTEGWLTDSGKVNLERVQLIMKDLALVEDEIFKSRRDSEMDFRRRGKDRRQRESKRQRLDDGMEFVRPNMGERFSRPSSQSSMMIEAAKSAMGGKSPMGDKGAMGGKSPIGDKGAMGGRSMMGGKRRFPETEEEMDPEDLKNEELDSKDEVRLWEDGYRPRYYQSKFGVSVSEEPRFCEEVARQYVRGLCWVLAYYYQGCPSWTWYYPYHYAPFAVDFVDVCRAQSQFEAGSEPFRPLEQLMGVFPADSRAHVPPVWRPLMTDAQSPVIDLYPTDFRVDLNGKRYDWQGVALLPFVDERRLLAALADLESGLDPEERARNVTGPDRFFVRADHPAAALLAALDDGPGDTVLEPALVAGVTGRLWRDKKAPSPGDRVPSAVAGSHLCPDLENVQAVSCFYRDPQFPTGYVFPATLLDKVVMPPPAIGPEALKIERENRDKRKTFNGNYNNNVAAASRIIRHSLPGTNPYLDTSSYSQGGYQGQSNQQGDRGGQKGQMYGFQGQGQSRGGYQGQGQSRGGYQGQGQSRGGYQGQGQSRDGYQGQGQSRGGYQVQGQSRGGYQGQGQSRDGYQGQGQSRGGYQVQGQSRGGYQGQGQSRGGYQGQGQFRGGSQGQADTYSQFQQQYGRGPQQPSRNPYLNNRR